MMKHVAAQLFSCECSAWLELIACAVVGLKTLRSLLCLVGAGCTAVVVLLMDLVLDVSAGFPDDSLAVIFAVPFSI